MVHRARDARGIGRQDEHEHDLRRRRQPRGDAGVGLAVAEVVARHAGHGGQGDHDEQVEHHRNEVHMHRCPHEQLYGKGHRKRCKHSGNNNHCQAK